MTNEPVKPQWAPRVSRYKIARLYNQDAKGIKDEELVDEVGYELLARVESCLGATEAMMGHVKCPVCGKAVERTSESDLVLLTCHACGWHLSEMEYRETYRRKHLGSPRLLEAFRVYVAEFEKARSYEKKIIAIDTVIHVYHGELQGEPGGPGGANLIGGTMSEIKVFLDGLTYGEFSTSGLRERHAHWREWGKIHAPWIDWGARSD